MRILLFPSIYISHGLKLSVNLLFISYIYNRSSILCCSVVFSDVALSTLALIDWLPCLVPIKLEGLR